jgi:hypothetical protein
MAAIHSLFNLRCKDLDLLNKGNIILIPKKTALFRSVTSDL